MSGDSPSRQRGAVGAPPEAEGSGGNRLAAGLATLLVAVVLASGVIFGLTAGVGAIWHAVTTSPTAPAPQGSRPSSPPAVAAIAIRLLVNPPPLGGVKGPDGKVHDAFVPGTFTMKAGSTYSVTVLNYDAFPHTWTSPELGVNAAVPAGSATNPSRITFTIHPKVAGVFAWFCATPCDPWAMMHDGYMRGHVTVIS